MIDLEAMKKVMDLEAMKLRATLLEWAPPERREDVEELARDCNALVAEVARLKAERDEAREKLYSSQPYYYDEWKKERAKIEAALAIKPVCKLPDCPCQRGMREALTGGREK